jgi:hypothetical protein
MEIPHAREVEVICSCINQSCGTERHRGDRRECLSSEDNHLLRERLAVSVVRRFDRSGTGWQVRAPAPWQGFRFSCSHDSQRSRKSSDELCRRRRWRRWWWWRQIVRIDASGWAFTGHSEAASVAAFRLCQVRSTIITSENRVERRPKSTLHGVVFVVVR